VPDKKLKALIIDDEAAILEELKWHLEQHGWEVTTAVDGIRGKECCEQLNQNLDLIISDVRMPGIDGQALLKNIAQNKRDLLPALFFMTAYDDVLREDAHEIGADAIFQKPFRVKELIAAAKHFIKVRNDFAAEAAKTATVLPSGRTPKVQ
jgi:two-component system alkaline phosphatase synthesis response regulator PhoP